MALGPLCRDLLPDYVRRVNDLSAARNAAPIAGPVTYESELAWFERASVTRDAAHFTIYVRALRATGALVYDPPMIEADAPAPIWLPIGRASLNRIDRHNRTAEYGVVVGDQEARGRGYGTEVTRQILDYAFTVIGLHSVILRVHAFNPAGAAAYRKVGFRDFGVRREAHWMGGRFWDTIYMECLASEFTSPYLAPIFAPVAPRCNDTCGAAGGPLVRPLHAILSRRELSGRNPSRDRTATFVCGSGVAD